MSRSNHIFETSESSPNPCGGGGDRQKELISRSLPKLIQKIAQDASANTAWAPALQAAPAAISVMATCLVASTSKLAGAIEVNRTGEIPGGGQITLPHKYLSTNLQHCSDLGRVAFTDAQNSMYRLRGYADYMIGTDGLVSNILEMLEDEEAARYDLRTAMEDLQENADRCKKEAGSIQGKFQLLLDFIMALQNAAIEKQNDTQVKQKENNSHIMRREAEREEHIQRIEDCRVEVEELKNLRTKAEADWRSAKNRLDGLAEVSALDVVANVDDALLMAEPEMAKEDPGLFVSIKRGLFGKSDTSKKEDERLRKELQDRYDKKIEGLLHKRRQELNVAKEEAQGRLNTAQSTFETLQKKLEAAEKTLTENKDKHLQAKLDLDASQADLKALASEKIELTDILKIIESSIKSLKQMKRYVDDMCVFFTEISSEVQLTMDGPTKQFLDKIENGVVASGNDAEARKIENLAFGQLSKRQLIQAALSIQGKLSIIGDVAGVYVHVSKLYIKPGINKMEGLTYLSKSEYTIRLAEFEEWCVNSVEEIQGFSRKQTKVMIDRMAIGVRAVARESLSIEAPA
ncbi:hypothetical protein H072_4800 [Dactylellina haptotyla CBS 200.50]|uniref:Uncharacterized protein n=1 Tax=Dactylellina haptotyla (strain CBS 200.50) TaxID=1284197 RepID=S8C0Z3_DACHA|nr:hypothetical protein H072_4800 [Dactylellina haptotyla CBS 200.50]